MASGLKWWPNLQLFTCINCTKTSWKARGPFVEQKFQNNKGRFFATPKYRSDLQKRLCRSKLILSAESSAGQGMGLKAITDLHPSTVQPHFAKEIPAALYYTGETLSPRQKSQREKDLESLGLSPQPCFDIVASTLLPFVTQHHDEKGLKFVDASDSITTVGRYIQHSSVPHKVNCEMISQEGLDWPYLRILKPVKAGDELLMNYEARLGDLSSDESPTQVQPTKNSEQNPAKRPVETMVRSGPKPNKRTKQITSLKAGETANSPGNQEWSPCSTRIKRKTDSKIPKKKQSKLKLQSETAAVKE